MSTDLTRSIAGGGYCGRAGHRRGGDPGAWVASWVASLGASTELDLTMHDDTIELELESARVELVDDVPIARIARIA